MLRLFFSKKERKSEAGEVCDAINNEELRENGKNCLINNWLTIAWLEMRVEDGKTIYFSIAPTSSSIHWWWWSWCVRILLQYRSRSVNFSCALTHHSPMGKSSQGGRWWRRLGPRTTSEFVPNVDCESEKFPPHECLPKNGRKRKKRVIIINVFDGGWWWFRFVFACRGKRIKGKTSKKINFPIIIRNRGNVSLAGSSE